MPTDRSGFRVARSRLALSYRLSTDDRVLEVDSGWSGFAQANAAPGLDPEAVIGQPVWNFISGEEVRALYRRLFDEVRLTESGRSVSFRCDSPGEIRHMSLSIRPLPCGELAIASSLVERLDREPVELLSNEGPRSDAMVSLCSWCKRVECPDGQWLEIEQSPWQGSEGVLPRVTHGICPDCEGMVATELDGLAPEAPL